MSFGGSVAAMITTLKANNSLRQNRNKFFDKSLRDIDLENGAKTKHINYRHLSEGEKLIIRAELKKKNKVAILKRVLAAVISLLITGLLLLLFLNYFNFDLLGKDFL